jgi:hypothetical protein
MSLLSKLSALILALGALLFASAAIACDGGNCGTGYGGSYGNREVYSCNNALYDCRTESSFYQPHCGDGCYRHSGCESGCYRRRSCCEHAYGRGFRDGYETARYEGDNWRPHDGYHGDNDGDRGDWREHDGDHHGHDWQGGDHHDGDGHDDDRHDGDHHGSR